MKTGDVAQGYDLGQLAKIDQHIYGEVSGAYKQNEIQCVCFNL